jgi:hypothetical protein
MKEEGGVVMSSERTLTAAEVHRARVLVARARERLHGAPSDLWGPLVGMLEQVLNGYERAQHDLDLVHTEVVRLRAALGVASRRMEGGPP